MAGINRPGVFIQELDARYEHPHLAMNDLRTRHMHPQSAAMELVSGGMHVTDVRQEYDVVSQQSRFEIVGVINDEQLARLHQAQYSSRHMTQLMGKGQIQSRRTRRSNRKVTL